MSNFPEKKKIKAKKTKWQFFNKTMSNITIKPTFWQYYLYLALLDCVLIANIYIASIMITFNIDFLEEIWQLDTAFDLIVCLNIFVTFLLQIERDDEYEDKLFVPPRTEHDMRQLILDKYEEKFGDPKGVADIASAVEMIAEIQKSEFPDLTFNSEKWKNYMQKTYKGRRITIKIVMETFLVWTK